MSQGFFEEDNGSPSMMRVLCLLSLLNAMGLAWYALVMGKADITLISMFLGFAFAGKAAQKAFEDKTNSTPTGK